MAYSMYLAGFDVKDVMMTDLISGRETLEDVNFIVFCGGFSTPMFSVLSRVGQVHSSTILRLKRHSISSMPVRIPFHSVSATVAS